MANTNRYYYIRNGKIGIVEDADGSQPTVNGVTSNYQTVQTSGLTIELDTKSVDTELDGTTVPVGGTDYLDQTFENIPARYHEAIVYMAIAYLYERPPGIDPNNAGYFGAKYQAIAKKAKKWSRSQYITSGVIRPQDY